jgi:uncharacterized iron-regulated membrane protein
MTLRTLIFWPHLAAGVIAGSVILLMSVTGVILTYERQVIAWSDARFRSASPADGANRLPVESVLSAFGREYPGLELTGVTVASDPEAAVSIAAGGRTLFFDAYSGGFLGEDTGRVRRFMSDVRAWHRWIAVEGDGRPIARAITGWSNLVFLFIVVTGFYLWFPRRRGWRSLKSQVLFARKATGKARDFNWHNVIGFWSAVPLFIVVLTALPISFPWANALVYRAVGETPPAGRGGGGGGREGRGGREGGGAREGRGGREGAAREASQRSQPAQTGVDAGFVKAQQQVPGWTTINLRLPSSARAPLPFAIDTGDGGQPQLRSTLTVDRAGAVVSYEAFADQSLGRRLRSISRFAHTGEALGLSGQTIAGLATAGAVFLVWTGISLTLRRFSGWIGRRKDRSAERADSRRMPAA